MLVKIFVSPKKDILDPQGKAVEHTLMSMGYSEVKDVRVGKYIVLKIDQTDRDEVVRRTKEMCDKFLTNPIIEDYRFEIDG